MDAILRTAPSYKMSRAETLLLQERAKDDERRDTEQRLKEQEAQIRLNKWLGSASPRAPPGKTLRGTRVQPPFGTFTDGDITDEYVIASKTPSSPQKHQHPISTTTPSPKAATTTTTPPSSSSQPSSPHSRNGMTSHNPIDAGSVGAAYALSALKARKSRELMGVATARLFGWQNADMAPEMPRVDPFDYAATLQHQITERQQAQYLAQEREIAEERERISALRHAGLMALQEEERRRREKQAQQRRFIDESLQAVRRLHDESTVQEELDLKEMRKEQERCYEERRAMRRAAAAVAAHARHSPPNNNGTTSSMEEDFSYLVSPPFDEEESAYASALAEAYRRVLRNHVHDMLTIAPTLRRIVLEPEFVSTNLW